MARIGRNEPCPCRSGKKYKRCCGLKERQAAARPASPEQAMKLTLMSGVEQIQAEAAKKNVTSRELGVFFFFATQSGDAWLMEMTDCDCVQLASGGVPLAPPIDENSETIEINWSHIFALRNKQVHLTAYADKEKSVLEEAPAKKLNAAMRRIRKKFSEDQLRKVHVAQPAEPSEQ
jgi:hypothetical protein